MTRGYRLLPRYQGSPNNPAKFTMRILSDMPTKLGVVLYKNVGVQLRRGLAQYILGHCDGALNGSQTIIYTAHIPSTGYQKVNALGFTQSTCCSHGLEAASSSRDLFRSLNWAKASFGSIFSMGSATKS